MNVGECSICSSFIHHNEMSALKCGHTFHFKCIGKWITNSKTCPICRKSNNKKDIIKLFTNGVPHSSADQFEAILGRIGELAEKQQQNFEESAKSILEEHIGQMEKQKQKQEENVTKEFGKIWNRFGTLEKQQQKQDEKWANASADQFETILGRIGELAKKQQQNFEESAKAADQLRVQQVEICAKIGEMEQKQMANCEQMNAKHDEIVAKIDEKSKNASDFGNAIQTKVTELEGQMKKILGKQNCWDVNKCHNGLTISAGHNNLTVNYKGNGNDWRSVFAKYSILDTSSVCGDIFYFEISVKNMKNCWAIFGFAVKHCAPLDDTIRWRNGTYAYEGDGFFWINGSWKSGNEQFGNDDTVGFGVNLVTKQLFFTKNGHRIGPTDLSICCSSSSSSADQLFPFVTLDDSANGIEANFGPNFMFNLATLIS